MTSFVHTSRRLTAAALATLVVAAGLALPGATPATAAPPPCSTVGLTVASAQGTNPIFYTDLGSTPRLDSAYTGWRVTNSGASPRSGLWVRLANFTSAGTLRLGVNANEPNAYPLATLAAGGADMAYVFLTASGLSTAVQNYDVQVWQGDPRLTSSTQVCQVSGNYKRVDDAIQANANKVSGTLVGPNPPGLGGVVTLTVYGQGTGTVGAGPSDDAGVFWMTPAAVSTWQPNAYQLQSARLTIDPDGSGAQPVTTFNDVLRTSLTGGDRAYSIVYTFTTIGVTTGSTSTYPVQNIASGTQVKHTTLSGYDAAAAFPPIQPAGNVTTVTKSSTASTVLPGATVPYTVTVNAGNFGTTFADLNGDGDATDPGETTVNTGVLDSIRDVVPAGATYVAGSATWQGVAIADPTLVSGTLVFAGPFFLTSNTTPRLTYSLVLPTAGTYVNSAYGVIGSTRIDTTLATTDDVPATVTVVARANTAPVVSGSASGTGPEDQALSGTLTATDVDSDPISWSIVTPPANGTASLVGGTWTFTPTANWNGTTTFVVRASDGRGGTTDQTVTVTITPVNDPPTITGGLSGAGPEDTNVTGIATASDIDGGPLSWSVVSQPTHGTATIAPNGAWTYTPDANWSGADSFGVRVSDGNGGFDTATVVIGITGAQDPPVITGGLSGSGPVNLPINGTATASDPDGGLLTWAIVGTASVGVASVAPNGSWTVTPPTGYVGTITFGIRVTDPDGNVDTAVVSVDVVPPNAPPTITGGLAGTGPEDTDIVGTATATDPESDPLTWSIDTQPANGTATIDPITGQWTYTPDPDFVGNDSFVIDVFDGTSTTSATVNVTVTANRSITSGAVGRCIDDTPWMYWDVTATGFDATGYTATVEWLDVDGNVVRTTTGLPLSGRQLWPGAAVDGSGNPTAWPGWRFVAGVWERYDDGLRDGMKVRVSVNPTDVVSVTYPPAEPACLAEPDAAPVADDVFATGPEDTVVTGGIVASDPNTGASLGFARTSTPANGTATVDPTTGAWSFTPAANWHGTTSFQVTVTDNGGISTTVTITIEITPVNDPPTVVGTPSGTGDGGPIGGTVGSNDIDGDTVTARRGAQPAHGTVVVDPDGSWVYTPDAGWEGVDSFEVVLDDGNGGEARVTVPVTTTLPRRTVVVRGYWDIDGNGSRNAGEPLIATTVGLGAASQPGPSGTFANVLLGASTARAAATGFDSSDVAVTVVAGVGSLVVDVPMEPSHAVSAGVAWDDDGNGSPDRWIAGAVITATWWGPDGLFGTADDVTVTVTAGSDGHWHGSLPLGEWTAVYDADGTSRTMSLAANGALEVVLSATVVPTTPTTPPTTAAPTVAPTTPTTVAPTTVTTAPSAPTMPTIAATPVAATTTTTATTTTATTTTAAATTGTTLPGTGGSPTDILMIAGLLLLIGLALVSARQPRRAIDR